MPCCTLLVIVVALLLAVGAGVFTYLYLNNFRFKYVDFSMFWRGRIKPAHVGQYYDTWHERYKEVYGDTIQSWRTEHIDDLHHYVMQSAGLKDGMHVLDAGCGLCGPALYFARRLDVTIEGITISAAQAAEASEKIAAAGLTDKISVQCGDYHHLSRFYPQASFDAVLFLESYGHAQDHKALAQEASKMLKPGGFVYLKDYFKKDMPPDVLQKQLIRMGLRNMDAIYRYHTPDLYHTIYIFRALNFELRRLQIPEFDDWDKNKVIQDFHEKNNIAFYNGKDHLFDQKNGRFIVDPYEIVFVKR